MYTTLLKIEIETGEANIPLSFDSSVSRVDSYM